MSKVPKLEPEFPKEVEVVVVLLILIELVLLEVVEEVPVLPVVLAEKEGTSLIKEVTLGVKVVWLPNPLLDPELPNEVLVDPDVPVFPKVELLKLFNPGFPEVENEVVWVAVEVDVEVDPCPPAPFILLFVGKPPLFPPVLKLLLLKEVLLVEDPVDVPLPKLVFPVFPNILNVPPLLIYLISWLASIGVNAELPPIFRLLRPWENAPNWLNILFNLWSSVFEKIDPDWDGLVVPLVAVVEVAEVVVVPVWDCKFLRYELTLVVVHILLWGLSIYWFWHWLQVFANIELHWAQFYTWQIGWHWPFRGW